MINKEEFLNPQDIPELFSRTPQYVRLKRELLGAEIDGVRPDFRGLPKSSPRAECTFRSFHINPKAGQPSQAGPAKNFLAWKSFRPGPAQRGRGPSWMTENEGSWVQALAVA